MTVINPDDVQDSSGSSSGDIPRLKVPYSAVVLVPPKEIWGPIQRIRKEYDPQISRWMPHVTLLYPFVQEEYLKAAADKLKRACAAMKPFQLTLRRFNHFDHGSGEATMYLEPEPTRKVEELHAELLNVMPWCDDTERFEAGYVPHLSVGTCRTEEVEGVKEQLQENWSPLQWNVREVDLIARPAEVNGSFDVHQSLPLGREDDSGSEQ
ncbi:MAG: 2'-5' RNA ligase family protein [Planctomycetota bacterium]